MSTTAPADLEPVGVVEAPTRLTYQYTPGRNQSRFLRALAEGRLTGRRCPTCQKVYVGPRGVCPMDGEQFTEEDVEIADTGTVVTFAVINVASRNIKVELPYVAAEVLLDGGDTTSNLLLKGVGPDQVRMGMRVRARWLPESEWETSLRNIDHVEPIDEPDTPFAEFKEYV